MDYSGLVLVVFIFGSILIIGFCIAMAVRSASKSKQQTQNMLGSRAFADIGSYIFYSGRPSQIMITQNNEIFYGPFQGQFYQVPGNMIPPMNHLERYSLGNAFAQQYGYTSYTCFGPQGNNLGYCQTGNAYLDRNTDIFIAGSAATGSWN